MSPAVNRHFARLRHALAAALGFEKTSTKYVITTDCAETAVYPVREVDTLWTRMCTFRE